MLERFSFITTAWIFLIVYSICFLLILRLSVFACTSKSLDFCLLTYIPAATYGSSIPSYLWFKGAASILIDHRSAALLWHTSDQQQRRRRLLHNDYAHSFGSCPPLLALSLLPSNEHNYQPRCVFVVHAPSPASCWASQSQCAENEGT